MKILVLENDPKEFALIQQSLLNGNRNTLIPLVSSEHVWQYIQSGEAHFLIANWDTSDLRDTQFIPRARAMKLPEPLYIVLTTKKISDDDSLSGADDTIQRPFKAADLKNRIAMAERIISLAGSLAMARSQLESQALFDSLTGFMNRAAFLKQSTGELERVRRASMPLSLIAMEINDFKTINNSFGVKAGDEVLRVFSRTIREKSRPYDCIGHWMEGRFMIMLSGVTGVDAEKVAERIIAEARGAKIEIENEAPLGIKISAGIVFMAQIGASTKIEPLIEQALQVLSRAKEAGGDQVLMVDVQVL